MFWRGFQVFATALNIAVVGMVAYFVCLRGVPIHPSGPAIEYKDFISILLTAIAVMIAVLTIFVAAAAVWGYSSLKEEACKIARDEAYRTALAEATHIASRAGIEIASQTQGSGDIDMGAAAGGDVG